VQYAHDAQLMCILRMMHNESAACAWCSAEVQPAHDVQQKFRLRMMHSGSTACKCCAVEGLVTACLCRISRKLRLRFANLSVPIGKACA
jgi:hypothetical protein